MGHWVPDYRRCLVCVLNVAPTVPCSSLSTHACGTNLAVRWTVSQKPPFRARGDFIVWQLFLLQKEQLSAREVSCRSDLTPCSCYSILDWTGGEASPWLLLNKTQKAPYKTEMSEKLSLIKNTLKARGLITFKQAPCYWDWGHFFLFWDQYTTLLIFPFCNSYFGDVSWAKSKYSTTSLATRAFCIGAAG